MSNCRGLEGQAGRKVKRIWFLNNNGDESVISKHGQTLICFNEYHGDHDEDWICLHDEAGKEIARYNASYAACIEWETKPDGGETT